MITGWDGPNSIYEVEVRGALFDWPDDWAVDRNIKFIDCTFTRIKDTDMVLNPSLTFPELTILHEAKRNISIKTEVMAENESKAKNLGSQLCIAESQIFAFCSDALLILDSAFGFSVIEKAANKAGVSMGCIKVIMKSSALTTKQLESALFTTIKALKESDDPDYLNRAIHWRSLGKMEFGSKIDRFVKFWIALEVLVDNEDGNDVQKVKNALKKVYPELKEKIQQDGIVGSKIFALRGEIFHEGKLSSGELQNPKLNIDTQLRQTEDILTDLLRFKLGMPSKNLAKKYFP